MENKYIMPDIKEVKALENFLIYLKFSNGIEKIYDMKLLIEKNKQYSKLKEIEYFKKIKINGETIEWENGEDICQKIYIMIVYLLIILKKR